MNWNILKDPSENEYFQFIDEKRNVFKVYPIVKQLCIQWALSENNKVLDIYERANDAQKVINERYRKPISVGDVVNRKWGFYKVVTIHPDYLVKELHFLPNQAISYQSHKYREEVWTVLRGDGVFRTEREELSLYTTFNGCDWCKSYLAPPPIPIREVKEPKKVGNVINIKFLQKHQFTAGKDGCLVLEVWRGSKFDEEDIERYE